MWAVPRSLATALLRSWANRPDTIVWDEPLLLPYVFHKGEDFGITRDSVIASGKETDGIKVIEMLLGPLPPGKTISYQKHQPHNFLEEIMGTEWLGQVTHCFLIRHPKDMLLSLSKIVPNFTFEQTGWADLKKLFDAVREMTGVIPPVVDARDLQDSPHRTLSLLCQAVGVTFSEAMLGWPSHSVDNLVEEEKPWYSAVLQSTHFQPYTAKAALLPAHLVDVFEQSHTIYQQLYDYRLH